MATPESKVKRVVKDSLAGLNAWSFAPVSNGMGVHGIPDRIACVPITVTPEMVGARIGLFVAVECKAPGKLGTVTPLQQRQLDGIRAAGGVGIVFDQTNCDALWLALKHWRCALLASPKKKAATKAANLDTEPVIEDAEHDTGEGGSV